MAHPNAELIERFYGAFAALDGDTMAACYAPNARFSDPVFVGLTGAEPGAMWRMLTARAKEFEVTLAEHDADDRHGTAHWLADYTFSTGRRVHNDVRAEFQFADGRIAEHVRFILVLRLGTTSARPGRTRARLDPDSAPQGAAPGAGGPG